jgi:hypothetical protein
MLTLPRASAMLPRGLRRLLLLRPEPEVLWDVCALCDVCACARWRVDDFRLHGV